MDDVMVEFYDETSRKTLCLTKMRGEWWIFRKRGPGEYRAAWKARKSDVERVLSAAGL